MRRALLIVAALALCSCWHVSVVSPTSERAPAKEHETNYHIFNGLTSSDVNAAECSDGIAKITYYHPWWSMVFLGPCTFGWVTATRVSYTCVEAKAALPAIGPPPPASTPVPATTAAVVAAATPIPIPTSAPAAGGPPKTFVENAKLRDVVPAPAGAAFDPAWKRISDALAKSHKLLPSEKNVLTTDWSDAQPHYRTRVRVEMSPDHSKIAVMTQAQWQEGDKWRAGADSDSQKAAVELVQQALKGP